MPCKKALFFGLMMVFLSSMSTHRHGSDISNTVAKSVAMLASGDTLQQPTKKYYICGWSMWREKG